MPQVPALACLSWLYIVTGMNRRAEHQRGKRSDDTDAGGKELQLASRLNCALFFAILSPSYSLQQAFFLF